MCPAFFIVDLGHTAEPAYTCKIFFLIDWTGSFLIFGMSVVYLFSFCSKYLFHVHSVGPFAASVAELGLMKERITSRNWRSILRLGRSSIRSTHLA